MGTCESFKWGQARAEFDGKSDRWFNLGHEILNGHDQLSDDRAGDHE